MFRKLIFLTGAPTSQNLLWNEAKLFDAPVAPFSDASMPAAPEPDRSFDSQPVRWRILRRTHLSKDLCALAAPDGRTPFFTTLGLAATSSGELNVEQNTEGLSQFYDHSFHVLKTADVSVSVETVPDESYQESCSLASSNASLATAQADPEPLPSMLLSIQGRVRDLKDIPSADYLDSIIPQTMTVNLIVGVLGVHPLRSVVTRQWNRELDIVEVVVADETRAGFAITFWLAVQDQTVLSKNASDSLRETLAGLRPRDIVLLRTVALSSFQRRVFGQSLRNGITKVDLLYRQPVEATDAGGVYSTKAIMGGQDQLSGTQPSVLMKVRKVREWLMRFVRKPTEATGDDEKGASVVRLPPDTQ